MAQELDNLRRAVTAHAEAARLTSDESLRSFPADVQDLLLQGLALSFDVCHEMSVRAIRAWIEENEEPDAGPDRVLVLAAGAGLIDDVELWETYAKARKVAVKPGAMAQEPALRTIAQTFGVDALGLLAELEDREE